MRVLIIVLALAAAVAISFEGAALAKPGHPEPASVVWDRRESPIRPGEPATIGFMVLHDGKCVERVAGRDVNPYVQAEHLKSGEVLRFDAGVDTPLHFNTEVELPQEGQWEISIRSTAVPDLSSSRIFFLADGDEAASGEFDILGLEGPAVLVGLGAVVAAGAFGAIRVRRDL